MKPLSILIVDDDEHIVRLLETWLAREGHQVVGAGGAVEAGRALRGGQFDLVITDVLMPDGDGLQLIGEFRKAHVRIVAMSGGGRYMQGDDCLKIAQGLGAHAAVMKPFTRDQLLAGVASAMT